MTFKDSKLRRKPVQIKCQDTQIVVIKRDSFVNVLVTSQDLSLIFFRIILVQLSSLVVERTGTVKHVSISLIDYAIVSYLLGSPRRLCRLRRTVWTL